MLRPSLCICLNMNISRYWMCARWNKKMGTISVGYFLFIAEVWIWENKVWGSDFKSFKNKISKGKYTRFFLRQAGIAFGCFNEKVVCFLIACEIWLSKTNIFYIFEFCWRRAGFCRKSKLLLHYWSIIEACTKKATGTQWHWLEDLYFSVVSEAIKHTFWWTQLI